MGRLVEGMRSIQFLAVISEGLGAQGLKTDALQETSRNDAIGVDVVTAQGKGPSTDAGDRSLGERAGLGHGCSGTVVKRNNESNNRLVQPSSGAKQRTSVTLPSIAAAATIAGLISKVRPLAEPWRPLKLRLLELALI